MTTPQSNPSRPRFWRTVLILGAVHFLVMTYGVFFIEPDACMFIIPACFMVLPAALAILLLRRMWAGAAVFLPYAIVGVLPTYYFEGPKLIGLWGVVAWCLIGPLVGLSGDLTLRVLPPSMQERWRAVVIGADLGAAYFATTLVALATLYREPSLEGHFRFFVTSVPFSLSWLVVNGGFAGYTAYALSKRA